MRRREFGLGQVNYGVIDAGLGQCGPMGQRVTAPVPAPRGPVMTPPSVSVGPRVQVPGIVPVPGRQIGPRVLATPDTFGGEGTECEYFDPEAFDTTRRAISEDWYADRRGAWRKGAIRCSTAYVPDGSGGYVARQTCWCAAV